jgi:hypothetical protein
VIKTGFRKEPELKLNKNELLSAQKDIKPPNLIIIA